MSKWRTVLDRLTGKEKQDRTNERLEQELLDNKAQMIALQNQINPHFLYNTLESIRAKALLHQEKDIAKMAETLALLFRYSIRKDNEPVTISDEIRCIRNFLIIQNFRFDNKFELQLQLDEVANVIETYPIPVMTLQPIVENAVHHGLEVKQDKGTIHITGFETEQLLILRIIDDGIGMNEETLRRVRCTLYEEMQEQLYLYEPDTGSQSGTGIALKNINRRLKLFYGKDYGLDIISAEKAGTTVELRLPRNPGSKEDEKRTADI